MVSKDQIQLMFVHTVTAEEASEIIITHVSPILLHYTDLVSYYVNKINN